MSMQFKGFDEAYAALFPEIWRAALLTSADRAAAEELTFQAFLRLGAASPETDAKATVYAALCDQIRAFYERKPRRLPRRDSFAAALPFPVTDALWAFMRLPLCRRMALLLKLAGFDPAASARFLHLPAFGIRLLLRKEQELAFLTDVLPEEGLPERISDRIYERFSERSVAVENAIHGARFAFDRLAPLLALAVLALFAAAWFVSESFR